MPDSLDTAQLIAIASVLGFASGIRLYLVLFAVGLAGYMQWVPLPSGLHLLAHPWVLGACGLMMAIEFLADKIPAIDSLWDSVHTLIRIPAGAALAAAVLGGDSATWTTIAALLGGSLAATSHFTKAGSQLATNLSSAESLKTFLDTLLVKTLDIADAPAGCISLYQRQAHEDARRKRAEQEIF